MTIFKHFILIGAFKCAFILSFPVLQPSDDRKDMISTNSSFPQKVVVYPLPVIVPASEVENFLHKEPNELQKMILEKDEDPESAITSNLKDNVIQRVYEVIKPVALDARELDSMNENFSLQLTQMSDSNSNSNFQSLFETSSKPPKPSPTPSKAPVRVLHELLGDYLPVVNPEVTNSSISEKNPVISSLASKRMKSSMSLKYPVSGNGKFISVLNTLNVILNRKMLPKSKTYDPFKVSTYNISFPEFTVNVSESRFGLTADKQTVDPVVEKPDEGSVVHEASLEEIAINNENFPRTIKTISETTELLNELNEFDEDPVVLRKSIMGDTNLSLIDSHFAALKAQSSKSSTNIPIQQTSGTNESFNDFQAITDHKASEQKIVPTEKTTDIPTDKKSEMLTEKPEKSSFAVVISAPSRVRALPVESSSAEMNRTILLPIVTNSTDENSWNFTSSESNNRSFNNDSFSSLKSNVPDNLSGPRVMNAEAKIGFDDSIISTTASYTLVVQSISDTNRSPKEILEFPSKGAIGQEHTTDEISTKIPISANSSNVDESQGTLKVQSEPINLKNSSHHRHRFLDHRPNRNNNLYSSNKGATFFDKKTEKNSTPLIHDSNRHKTDENLDTLQSTSSPNLNIFASTSKIPEYLSTLPETNFPENVEKVDHVTESLLSTTSFAENQPITELIQGAVFSEARTKNFKPKTIASSLPYVGDHTKTTPYKSIENIDIIVPSHSTISTDGFVDLGEETTTDIEFETTQGFNYHTANDGLTYGITNVVDADKDSKANIKFESTQQSDYSTDEDSIDETTDFNYLDKKNITEIDSKSTLQSNYSTDDDLSVTITDNVDSSEEDNSTEFKSTQPPNYTTDDNFTSETTDFTSETTDSTSETTDFTSETTDSTSETTDFTSETTDFTSETTDSTSETTDFTSETTDFTSETTDFTSETTDFTSETTDFTSETTDFTSETTDFTDSNEENTADDNLTDRTTIFVDSDKEIIDYLTFKSTQESNTNTADDLPDETSNFVDLVKENIFNKFESTQQSVYTTDNVLTDEATSFVDLDKENMTSKFENTQKPNISTDDSTDETDFVNLGAEIITPLEFESTKYSDNSTNEYSAHEMTETTMISSSTEKTDEYETPISKSLESVTDINHSQFEEGNNTHPSQLDKIIQNEEVVANIFNSSESKQDPLDLNEGTHFPPRESVSPYPSLVKLKRSFEVTEIYSSRHLQAVNNDKYTLMKIPEIPKELFERERKKNGTELKTVFKPSSIKDENVLTKSFSISSRQDAEKLLKRLSREFGREENTEVDDETEIDESGMKIVKNSTRKGKWIESLSNAELLELMKSPQKKTHFKK